MKIALPIHSYELWSTQSSPSRLVNCYPEQLPPEGRSQVIVSRTSGVKAWTTVGSGPIAGMNAAQVELTTGHFEYLYVDSGSEWYYVDSAKATILIRSVYALIPTFCAS